MRADPFVTTAATEQEVIAALRLALAGPPTVPVWWGYAPAETVEAPPSLPLVVVMRSSALVRTDMIDMCEQPVELGDVTLQVRAWHENYGEARALQQTIRATLRALPGWALQGEFDARDGDLRAWAISSDWLALATQLE